MQNTRVMDFEFLIVISVNDRFLPHLTYLSVVWLVEFINFTVKIQRNPSVVMQLQLCSKYSEKIFSQIQMSKGHTA